MVRSSATTLKGKALQLLALRDYSRAEMHEKLLRWLRTQAAKQANGTGQHSDADISASVVGAEREGASACIFKLQAEHDEAFNALGGEAHFSGNADSIAANDEADHGASANGVHEQAATWLEEQSRLIPAMLDELQAKGWLSDQRAAEALLHQRSARFGQARLRQLLQQKGIDAETSQALLQETAHSELARAHALWQKKFGTLPATPAERARQMRFLASRGFAAAIIQRILRQDSDALDLDDIA